MTLQPGTFNSLPSKEKLLALVEEERRHNADLTSYMWHIVPIAARFGDEVFAVAAKSLSERGVDVTATQLKELAEELQTPEGGERYTEQRRRHVMLHTTG
jgi:hypothetical protein